MLGMQATTDDGPDMEVVVPIIADIDIMLEL